MIVTSEFPPEPGGIGNHAYNLAKQLTLQKIEVTVCTDQRIPNSEIEKKFDGNEPFPIQRVRLRKTRSLMFVFRFFKIIKAVSAADMVIASGKFSLWAVALSSFLYKRKFIAVIHGSEVNFKKSFLKKSINFSLQRFDRVVAVSNYTKSLVKSLRLRHIEVIPNGFEIKGINKKTVGKLKGKPSLITVGSVTARKGQKNVITSLQEVLREFPKLHYHVVGNSQKKEEFLKFAKEQNVDGHITFYGSVSDVEKENLLERSDIFVMLSEQTKEGDVEGFGIALLEANYYGIPTIGSKNCGIEDAIENHKSGILIDNKNPKEFKNAIVKILDNYVDFQENSKLWASKFTWDIIIDKYIKIIKS